MHVKPDEQSVCAVHTSPSVPSTGSGGFDVGGLGPMGLAGGCVGFATGGQEAVQAVIGHAVTVCKKAPNKVAKTMLRGVPAA